MVFQIHAIVLPLTNKFSNIFFLIQRYKKMSNIQGHNYDKKKQFNTVSDAYPDKNKWYNHSTGYWHGQESSIKGMLGGFDIVHDDDVKESVFFINTIFGNYNTTITSILDCGAGTLQVFSNLLL